MKRWIWQQDNYPNFTYNSKKLEDLTQKISLEQGYLIAITQTMNKDNIIQKQFEAFLTSIIKTFFLFFKGHNVLIVRYMTNNGTLCPVIPQYEDKRTLSI